MGARETLDAARRGSRNLRFRDVQRLLEALGFRLVRVSGSHHIFSAPNVQELVNLQEVDGQCKPYQLRQSVRLVERYNLDLEPGS
jgi:predicted RNA binding protein YcfA (HicA-like mRNA interferase family)